MDASAVCEIESRLWRLISVQFHQELCKYCVSNLKSLDLLEAVVQSANFYSAFPFISWETNSPRMLRRVQLHQFHAISLNLVRRLFVTN